MSRHEIIEEIQPSDDLATRCKSLILARLEHNAKSRLTHRSARVWCNWNGPIPPRRGRPATSRGEWTRLRRKRNPGPTSQEPLDDEDEHRIVTAFLDVFSPTRPLDPTT